MFEGLSRDERLLLLELLCSFARADLEVTDAERLDKLKDGLGLA